MPGFKGDQKIGQGYRDGYRMPLEHVIWMDTEVIPGAEIEITIDNEKHLVTKSFSAFVPAGVQHGPVIIRKAVRPIFHFSAGTTSQYK